jgi:hypothetical protein
MTNERHACASPEAASQENERQNPFSWLHECRGRFYYTFQKTKECQYNVVVEATVKIIVKVKKSRHINCSTGQQESKYTLQSQETVDGSICQRSLHKSP